MFSLQLIFTELNFEVSDLKKEIEKKQRGRDLGPGIYLFKNTIIVKEAFGNKIWIRENNDQTVSIFYLNKNKRINVSENDFIKTMKSYKRFSNCQCLNTVAAISSLY